MMHIKLTVEQEATIKEMGSFSLTGRTKIDLSTGEQEEQYKPKTYWFMPVVFEETADPLKFMVHELPESITKQIVDFINQ